MTQLSTELKKYVIVFHDRSKKYLSEENALKILAKYETLQTINIGPTAYAKSSISKILPLAEFYEQYPDQRPAPDLVSTATELFREPRKLASTKDALTSLLRGFDTAIEENGGYDRASPLTRELRKKMERSLATVGK